MYRTKFDNVKYPGEVLVSETGQVFRISLYLFIMKRHPSTNLKLNLKNPDSLNILLITFYTLKNTKCKLLCDIFFLVHLFQYMALTIFNCSQIIYCYESIHTKLPVDNIFSFDTSGFCIS